MRRIESDGEILKAQAYQEILLAFEAMFQVGDVAADCSVGWHEHALGGWIDDRLAILADTGSPAGVVIIACRRARYGELPATMEPSAWTPDPRN
jgi:hypothetical protein